MAVLDVAGGAGPAAGFGAVAIRPRRETLRAGLGALAFAALTVVFAVALVAALR